MQTKRMIKCMVWSDGIIIAIIHTSLFLMQETDMITEQLQ